MSTVYAWARQLFDDRGEILCHIKALSRPILKERLDDVIRVRTTFYDYNLAEHRPAVASVNALQQLDRFSFRRPGKSNGPLN